MNALGSIDGFSDPTTRPTSNKRLDEMNARFFVVKDSGKAFVGTFEQEHGRMKLELMPFGHFAMLLMNQKVKVKSRDVPLGKWWLEHPKRRQYAGLIFQPGNNAPVINDKLNLWRGWAFEPKAGDWSLLQEHIKTVVASNNDEAFEYVMNWLAWCVQHPDQPAEVVLVMKGKKGTGKGTVGNAMRRLFGQHALQISNAKHLVGHFNKHLRDCVLLFADEAFWPGDIASLGTLKRLVTEPTIFIEAKGRDGVEVPNMLHVIMASNEDWVVPAGDHERRFFVLEVSDAKMQNKEWFKAINDQLENGGYAAMLHDLLHRDLTGFHPRQLPECNDLTSQQAQSLSALDAWWVELLERGALPGCDPKQPHMARSNDWQEVIKNDMGGVVRTVMHPGLYTAARSIEPRLRNFSEHKLGGHLTKQGCTNDTKVLRQRGWTFRALSELRQKWEQRFPGWRWRNPDLSQWEPDDGDAVPF